MTWYPRKNNQAVREVPSDTKQLFEEAKMRKGDKRLIDCLVCDGVGEVIDAKTGKIRACAGCKKTGKIINPKYRHRHA